MVEERKRIRIGDLLVAKQLITEDQLMEALAEQKRSGRKLGAALIEMGLIQEDELLRLLSEQLNVPFVDLKNYQFDREVVKQLPEMLARRYRAVVLKEEADGTLMVAMADPTDIYGFDDLSRALKKPLKQVVVRESDLLDIMDLSYSQEEAISQLAEELSDELEETEQFDLADALGVGDATAEDTPVVKLLQKIFEESINTKASDIHIEPDEKVLRIRQRIDGVLSEQVMNEKRIAPALVVRLKLMASLDISEKRRPQDGRFALKVKNHNIDVRLNTMPTQWGESVVMRLLDHTGGVQPLAKAGMPSKLLEKFRDAIHRPHGLVLVTGPTGSGKTTTLYGALSELNQPEKKIITVEDPVEYRLPRIQQVQVNEKIELGFGEVLRATLRQDPDILLVGEIRDKESAEIGLRAAMTGHMVLSTLHTNDAVTSAIRLTDMGVDSFLVASALKTIIAQRLVRRVCEKCAQPYEPTANQQSLLEKMGKRVDLTNASYRKGTGCSYCYNTGYKGRVGVFEMLDIDRDMAVALRDGDVNGFTEAAHRNPGYRPLSYSALFYAAKGITTLDEMVRVSAQVEDESINEED
ncbi:MAG: Flp pilus assembly complex ATPase component TadA [Cellvibrionaceae bacterium]